jgi:hypothetical protein
MAQRRNLSIGITINLDNYENLRLEVGGEVCGDQDAEELIAYLDSILSRLGRGTPETAERVDAYRRRVLSSPEKSIPGIPAAMAEIPGGNESAPAEMTKPQPSPQETPVRPSIITPALDSGQTLTVPLKESEDITPPSVSSVSVRETTSPSVEKKVQPAAKKEPPLSSIPSVVKKGTFPAVRKEASPSAKNETSVPVASTMKKETSSPVATGRGTKSVEPTPGGHDMPKQEMFSCERCGEPITPVQRKLSRMFQNKDLCKKCLQQP